jgi:pimeloyl-ACP methyl ester carboxylesterase
MREDLRQFADALGLDRFVLGGHSMGGIEGAGHAVHRNRRAEFLTAVWSFLSSSARVRPRPPIGA